MKGKAHVLSVCLPFSLELRLKRVSPAGCVSNKEDTEGGPTGGSAALAPESGSPQPQPMGDSASAPPQPQSVAPIPDLRRASPRPGQPCPESPPRTAGPRAVPRWCPSPGNLSGGQCPPKALPRQAALEGKAGAFLLSVGAKRHRFARRNKLSGRPSSHGLLTCFQLTPRAHTGRGSRGFYLWQNAAHFSAQILGRRRRASEVSPEACHALRLPAWTRGPQERLSAGSLLPHPVLGPGDPMALRVPCFYGS